MTLRPIHLATLATLAGAALPLQALAQTPPPAARVLHVTGEGRVAVAPDVAVLLVGVEATGPDLAKVTRDAAGGMRKILAALGEAGIAEKDIQTTQHDIRVERPWKDNRPGPITGYTVSDEVRITVRDLGRLAPALDRVTAAGANSLHSLAFQKDDPGPERARALAAAYAAARGKAEALARAAGVTLGEVLTLGESTQAQPLPMRMGYAAARAAPEPGTPVSAGQVEIAATVDVVYAIR
jgi:uncharacterized protein